MIGSLIISEDDRVIGYVLKQHVRTFSTIYECLDFEDPGEWLEYEQRFQPINEFFVRFVSRSFSSGDCEDF